ncbi:MAG TPA: electron transfer flavoprotein subunit alpha/FixB family protein [Acidimicrobiales bacterium]|jgi:electron transfer flavoprotein alpha subunit|nr:electron transfer flavoprotein subunit alpha/FixB family protein [Acidimicrobiales bacterium]
MDRIWVLAETTEQGPTPVTLELLTEARSLASGVEAVAWGTETASIAGTLGEYGASRVYDVGDLGGSLPGVPVAAAIAALIGQGERPDAILVPASYDGRDVAGRLSAMLDRPVLTNITGLAEQGGGLLTEHQVFGGTKVVHARFTGEGPGIYVVRAKSFAAEPAGGGAAEVVAAPAGDAGPTAAAKIVERHVEQASGPKLDEAAVVVSGGRGLGAAENYALIEELARLLHGAAGASRAIVDAGWVPYSHQVGQTGKTVKPTLYVACGISGATQHLVGMKGSKNIIAVNKDQEAPIFSVADLGIVGDVHKVLPALIEALKSKT